MIPQRNLSLLANRLAKTGGRRIPEAVLERDYCLAWFLVGLSQAPLRDRLIFKGGTALKRCYFPDYRFSEDLDFTLAEEMSLDAILAGLEDVYVQVQSASDIVFRYSRADRRQHGNSHTFYLAYDGPLPASDREVKVDITIRERLVCQPENRPVLRGYHEYFDLPENFTVRAYALDEIAVEKIAALTDRARNEPRDLFDVWRLVAGEHVELPMLTRQLDEKLEFRGRSRMNLYEGLIGKEKRYKALWATRLGPQMTMLPPFEEVFRYVSRALRTIAAKD